MRCEACKNRIIKQLERSYPSPIFQTQDLPDYAPNPNVTISLEKLKDFRSDYGMVSEFAAWLCDVSIDQLTPILMLNIMMNVDRKDIIK